MKPRRLASWSTSTATRSTARVGPMYGPWSNRHVRPPFGRVRRDAGTSCGRRGRTDSTARSTNENTTTHFSTQLMNPYFHTERNSDFPDRHPVNTFIERSSGFIPGDSWEPMVRDAPRCSRSPELAAFVAACLEVPELHCYADPLAGLTANILDPGQQFTWHFDTNDFAVTVLVARSRRRWELRIRPQHPIAARRGLRGASSDARRRARRRQTRSTCAPAISRSSAVATRCTRSPGSRRKLDAAPRRDLRLHEPKPGVIGRVERTTAAVRSRARRAPPSRGRAGPSRCTHRLSVRRKRGTDGRQDR